MNQPGRCTIFGGSGFLGRHIAQRLADHAVRMRIAARTVEPDCMDLPAPVECRRVDIRDETGVAAALDETDVAVNAVALYTEGGGLDFHSVHVAGAQRLARLARAAGVGTFLHISGIGVDEHSPSAYVRARALGESAVRRAFPQATVIRPSVLFGPGDRFLSTLDGLTRLPLIPLFGTGETRLQPVHVDDVARALARIVDRPALAGRVVELGGGDILQYREVVRAVCRHRGRRRILLPVPFPAWHLLAAGCSLLPSAPLTRDQVILMQADNVVAGPVATFDDLGMEPRGLLAALPECLPAHRHR